MDLGSLAGVHPRKVAAVKVQRVSMNQQQDGLLFFLEDDALKT